MGVLILGPLAVAQGPDVADEGHDDGAVRVVEVEVRVSHSPTLPVPVPPPTSRVRTLPEVERYTEVQGHHRPGGRDAVGVEADTTLGLRTSSDNGSLTHTSDPRTPVP